MVTYRDNTIYSLVILNCKGEFIRLVNPVDKQYKHKTYKEMLDSIVYICKYNGYSLEYKKMFNAKFYYIALTCIDDNKGIIEHTISW